MRYIFLINLETQQITFSVTQPKLLSTKVETREPDLVRTLKRGNMKEKWGLQLLHRVLDGRLELCVKKGKDSLFLIQFRKKTLKFLIFQPQFAQLAQNKQNRFRLPQVIYPVSFSSLFSTNFQILLCST